MSVHIHSMPILRFIPLGLLLVCAVLVRAQPNPNGNGANAAPSNTRADSSLPLVDRKEDGEPVLQPTQNSLPPQPLFIPVPPLPVLDAPQLYSPLAFESNSFGVNFGSPFFDSNEFFGFGFNQVSSSSTSPEANHLVDDVFQSELDTSASSSRGVKEEADHEAIASSPSDSSSVEPLDIYHASADAPDQVEADVVPMDIDPHETSSDSALLRSEPDQGNTRTNEDMLQPTSPSLFNNAAALPSIPNDSLLQTADGMIQFRYRSIIGDGNCQWRCFARSIAQSEGAIWDDTQEMFIIIILKRFAAESVLRNWYGVRNSIARQDVARTFTDYLNIGGHGSEHSLLLSSHFVRRPVWIWTRVQDGSNNLNASPWLRYNAQYEADPIHLLYDPEQEFNGINLSGHYSLLEAISVNEVETLSNQGSMSSSSGSSSLVMQPRSTTSSSAEGRQSVSSNKKKRTTLETSTDNDDVPDQPDHLDRPSKRPKFEGSNHPETVSQAAASSSSSSSTSSSSDVPASAVPVEETAWSCNSDGPLPGCVSMLAHSRNLEQLISSYESNDYFTVVYGSRAYVSRLNRQMRTIDVLHERPVITSDQLSCRPLAAVTIGTTPHRNIERIAENHILPIVPNQSTIFHRVALRRLQCVWSGENPRSGYTNELVFIFSVFNQPFQLQVPLLSDPARSLYQKRSRGSYAFQLVVDGRAVGLPEASQVSVRLNLRCRWAQSSRTPERCAERSQQKQKGINDFRYGLCTVYSRLNDAEAYYLEVELESSAPQFVQLLDAHTTQQKVNFSTNSSAGQVSLICEPTPVDVAVARFTEFKRRALELLRTAIEAARDASIPEVRAPLSSAGANSNNGSRFSRNTK